jgi:hypothetical protein
MLLALAVAARPFAAQPSSLRQSDLENTGMRIASVEKSIADKLSARATRLFGALESSGVPSGVETGGVERLPD